MSSYNQIIPGLWVGNDYASRDYIFLQQQRIGAVLNCTPDINNELAKPQVGSLEYMRINVNDNGQDTAKMINYLPHAVSFIYKNLVLDQKNVFVHCHAGIQRSCIIIAAYLCKTENLSPEVAIKRVLERRPVAFGNGSRINFKQALEEYYNNTCLFVVNPEWTFE